MLPLSLWSRFSSGALGAASLLLASLSAANPVAAQESTAAANTSASPAATAAATIVEATPARSTARMRLFGQNGVMIDFYENSQCLGGSGPKTRASGGFGDAFSSFVGRAKNTSIGMTETPTTAHLAARDGIFSRAYFREYEVAANQPVALNMAFQNAPGGARCSQFGGTFTPEAGKEYEVTLDLQGQQCMAVVREIQKDGQGEASLKELTLLPTFKCH
jgi:hypothetical protein